MNTRNWKVTPTEQETLEKCYMVLTEEQIADLEGEALELAAVELHEDEAAELYVLLIKKLIVRNLRTELNSVSR